MSERELLTTTELAARCGLTRQAILMRVNRGTLRPAFTTSGGQYLFRAEQATVIKPNVPGGDAA